MPKKKKKSADGPKIGDSTKADQRTDQSSQTHSQLESNGAETDSKPSWNLNKRRCVSVILLVHLIAIFSAPFSGPPPSSTLSRRLYSVFEPYLRATYMSHGYRFFAPSPGPSHLIRYEIETQDGQTQSQTIPDLKRHWPRQFYHRHFMLSESMKDFVVDISDADFEIQMDQLTAQMESALQEGQVEIADEIRTEIDLQRQDFANRKSLMKKIFKPLADSLMLQNDAKRVRLYAIRHLLPLPQEVRLGKKLDDPEYYLEILAYDSKSQ